MVVNAKQKTNFDMIISFLMFIFQFLSRNYPNLTFELKNSRATITIIFMSYVMRDGLIGLALGVLSNGH